MSPTEPLADVTCADLAAGLELLACPACHGDLELDSAEARVPMRPPL